MFYKPEKK